MIGSTVRCRQTGDDVWVIRQVDGDRLHLRSRDGNRYTGRVCGAGDVTVVAPPPTFTPGIQITHDGQTVIVREDRGDDVVCVTQDARWIWRDGTRLLMRGGNGYTVNKADLVVEVQP